ncbi:MAG TPA: carboxypeptidase regulatory-like domain-containing protein, partial [Pyrinomonadaceae bacterium]
MRSSARIALPIVAAVLCFATSLFAQTQVKQPAAKTPGGSVSGRITIKDKPAPGVLVALRKTQANPWEAINKAVTDQNGVYRITNVAPGSYAVMPTAPAYVAA